MKSLVQVALVLAVILVFPLIIIGVTGVLTLDDIKSALAAAAQINPMLVAFVVIVLLLLDLFIPVPTLALGLLAGYFLGALYGGLSVAIGVMLAGLTGYTICWYYGPGLLLKIYKDPQKLREMGDIFSTRGTIVLIICRALPMLPEVSCCLAGANRMGFGKFLLCYAIGSVPYAFITAYAGSQSSLSDPRPAIFAGIAILLVLWLAWLIFLRSNKPRALQQT